MGVGDGRPDGEKAAARRPRGWSIWSVKLDTMSEASTAAGGRFFRRRTVWLPTWQGWLVVLLLVAGAGLAATLLAYPFFAVNDRASSRIMVVEGWVPDYAMQQVVEVYKKGDLDKVYVTGVPLDYGAPLSEQGTYAEVGAEVLIKLGLPKEVVQAVPAPRVRQDRTYASAVSLARYLREAGIQVRSFNLVSMGPHARRSRLLFQKAFGPGVAIGVVSVPHADFDPARWYVSSAGVRSVINEAIAYAYARLLFWPRPVGVGPAAVGIPNSPPPSAKFPQPTRQTVATP